MKKYFYFYFVFFFEHTPVNVELVKMRTIFELTGGRDSSEPRNMESIVRSSIIGLLSSRVSWLRCAAAEIQ